MIYGNIIREQKIAINFEDQFNIIKEYYENEIDILNLAISYKNSLNGTNINEVSIEAIHENFVNDIIEKIKKIIKKIKDYLAAKFRILKQDVTENFKSKKVHIQRVSQNIDAIRKDSSLTDKEKRSKIISQLKQILKFKDANDIVSGDTSEDIYDVVEMYQSPSFKTSIEPLFDIIDELDKIENAMYNISDEESENKLYEYFGEAKGKIDKVFENNTKSKILERLEDKKIKTLKISGNFTAMEIYSEYKSNFEDCEQFINKYKNKSDSDLEKVKSIGIKIAPRCKNPEKIAAICNYYASIYSRVLDIASMYIIEISKNTYMGQLA